MTVEEKAKRYDKVSKEVKDFFEGKRKMCSDITQSLEYLFPELKESEDERIRKELIFYLGDMPEDTELRNGVTNRDVLVWLEKQGEKKYSWDENEKAYFEFTQAAIENCYDKNNPLRKELVDWLNSFKDKVQSKQTKSALETVKEEPIDNANKVEPKFEVGQWIVWQDKCYKVIYNGCGYKLVDQNGLSTSLEYGTIDENAHIWDITKDAKDGDILASKRTSCVLIFKGREGTSFISYYNTCTDYNGDWNRVNFLPATKEQRELLFAKMKKDGYKLDAENKQLKRI